MTAYTLIRSDRRTMALEVTLDLTVVVRAPRRCSQRQADAFVAAHAAWIEKSLTRQRERQAKRESRRVTPEEEVRLRQEAARVIPERVAEYAARMGVTPTGVRITGAQKRFGSCSSKNSLCFAWRLMQYPPEAVDYVVVHELCHMVHHNHSRAFWTLVEQVMPDYRRRQQLLRD